MDLIKQYILALTNLYGQVTADVITDIYNSQNDGQISEDDVEVYLFEDLSNQHVYAYKDHFVHETIMAFKDFKSMRKKKADKPYYVPNKEELLKYSDVTYYEKPKQYDDLMKYIEKNFFPNDHEKAEILCQNIRWECIVGPDMQLVFKMLNTFEVSFKNEDQMNEVLKLVMELANNVRLWENNGHTPQEIFEKLEKPNPRQLSDKPNLRPLTEKSFEFGGSNVIDIKSKQKIGRNDPCPCGSGKKYKKCCLGKDK